MEARTQRLHDIMATHRLKAQDVATILNRSPAIVRKWRIEYRIIPSHMLSLLELRVREVAVNDAIATLKEAIGA